ncbi:MAG TPA: hypothetical protein VH062_26655 [Polyangiaceae bacterium]|nr:hypothetical protein [Polyangiaceae bacterium]
MRDGRQLFERFGHAQLLLRGAWLVSEQTLFAEATVPEVHMRCRAQRGEKPAAFFRVRRGALAGQERQRFVRPNPFTLLAGTAAPGLAERLDLAPTVSQDHVKAIRRSKHNRPNDQSGGQAHVGATLVPLSCLLSTWSGVSSTRE